MAASSIVPHKSLAVVLHGRMGGMASLMPGAPGRPLRSFDGAVPSPSSAALCAASLEQHVIGPNRAHFAVDVFGHSWSPEIGATLDGLFAPRRSLHEEGISKANFRCPDPNFSHGYCHRTVSHLLGIARAMRLKKLEEIARGREYDVVFLSRWDILWRTPLLELRALPRWHAHRERRRRTVWLPRICIPIDGGDRPGSAFRSAVCGGSASTWLATQAARECSRAARACQPDMSLEARELYVMDWWLVLGTSADADEFAEGVSGRFAEHGTRVLQRLAAQKRGAIAMGHAWFGAQLLWAMNATLAHVGNIGVDFHLGRAWNEFDCNGLQPACAGRVCGTSDMLPARPWHTSQSARWPIESSESFAPLVSIPDPNSQMASSCEDRYFLCRRGSRACVETDANAAPMDRTALKALFLGCAEGLCAPVTPSTARLRQNVQEAPSRAPSTASLSTPSANTSACARRLLRLWLNMSGSVRFPKAMQRHSAAPALDAFQSRMAALPLADEMMSDPLPLSATCERAWSRSGGVRYPRFE
jgi:hypothetical protein